MAHLINSRNPTLDILRVIAMLGVMLIHSPAVVDAELTPGIYFIREYITIGTVPAFFILSGYLMAKKVKDPSVRFSAFFKDKLHSLIIPFLIWNGLLIFGALSMKMAGIGNDMSQSGAYLGIDFSFSSITSAWLGIDRSPIVYQFWFLRDLIIVSLVTFFVIRYLPPLPFLPLILLLIPNHMAASFGFYLIGVQLHGVLSLERFPSVVSCYLFCLGWGLLGLADMAGYVDLPFPLVSLGAVIFFFFLAVILAAWRPTARLAMLAPAVFFMYAAHEPLQLVMGRLWEKFNVPYYGYYVSFFTVPAVSLIIVLTFYAMMKRCLPKTLSVITGGR